LFLLAVCPVYKCCSYCTPVHYRVTRVHAYKIAYALLSGDIIRKDLIR
jgi:hypothetical protein